MINSLNSSNGRGESLLQTEILTISLLDKAHNLPPRPTHLPFTPSTKLRLLYQLLTAPSIQQGLRITPGEGRWKRVKSIMALHDDEADKRWVERWTGGDWKIGLLTGLSGQISNDVSRIISCFKTRGMGLTDSNHPQYICTLISYRPTLDLSSLSPSSPLWSTSSHQRTLTRQSTPSSSLSTQRHS
jgi:hypothetical protein